MNNHSTVFHEYDTTVMDQVSLTDRNHTSEECSICFGVITNKTFADVCLHHFCYECIVSWLKVKAACPLCVQPISSIFTNVISRDVYDVEPVVPPEVDVLANYGNDFSPPVDGTDTESSYDDMESMDMSGSAFGDSFIEEDYENDDISYHSESSENAQTHFYGGSEDDADEQNDVEPGWGDEDWEDGDNLSTGDNLDGYEADGHEDDNNEENHSGYEYSEGANSDIEENNEEMYFCDNLSYGNESEDNEEIANNTNEEIVSDSQEESASDYQEEDACDFHENSVEESASDYQEEDASDFHENSAEESASDYQEEDASDGYRDDEDDYAEGASHSDEEKLDFDVDSYNDYCEYDEELSNHDYLDYDDAAVYLYSGYY